MFWTTVDTLTLCAPTCCVRAHQVLASLVKGIAARAASPLTPMPFPERAREWALKSTMLAVQSYMLAATAHGLATAPMEGFDAERLRLYVDVPDRYSVAVVVATGYEVGDSEETETTAPSPRFAPGEVFFADTFGVPFDGVATLPEEADES